MQLLQHAAFHGAGTAAQVVKILAGEVAQGSVEGLVLDSVQQGVLARVTPADGQVAIVQGRDQFADLRGLHLQVGWQGDDELSLGMFKTGGECRGLAEPARHFDDGESFALIDECLKGLLHRREITVQDEDEFMALVDGGEGLAVGRINGADVVMALRDGNDYREAGRLDILIVIHVRLLPCLSTWKVLLSCSRPSDR